MQKKPLMESGQTDFSASPKKRRGRKWKKRTVVAAILIILVIPAAILLGAQWMQTFQFSFFGITVSIRSYYFISLFVIICTLIPFFMVFEKRKPQARELVVIAVLSAIAVAGRAAFFMLPQFKPVVAIVIIAGVCFGGEAGFLVGAVSGFVSNFFFGQGPWTPWQMFSFGIIGFLAGVFFQTGLLNKSRLALCIFGGLSTFFIYGILMDISSVMMVSSTTSQEPFWVAMVSGIPFNLIHAAATVFFLFVISQPMIEKLDRIKIKYGLLEP